MSRYIDEHRGRFGVEPICKTLDVSASAYYERATGQRSRRVTCDGDPVLEPDLAAPAWCVGRRSPWPVSRRERGRCSPSRCASERSGSGVLVLYRDRPGALSADELGLGLVLADVGTQLILGAQAGAPPDALHDVLATEPAHWAEIHQATGMLSVQLERALRRARAAAVPK